VTAYRFTRAGKLFAEALWSLTACVPEAVSAMCAAAAMRWKRRARTSMPYDLVDAYDYAEKNHQRPVGGRRLFPGTGAPPDVGSDQHALGRVHRVSGPFREGV